MPSLRSPEPDLAEEVPGFKADSGTAEPQIGPNSSPLALQTPIRLSEKELLTPVNHGTHGSQGNLSTEPKSNQAWNGSIGKILPATYLYYPNC